MTLCVLRSFHLFRTNIVLIMRTTHTHIPKSVYGVSGCDKEMSENCDNRFFVFKPMTNTRFMFLSVKHLAVTIEKTYHQKYMCVGISMIIVNECWSSSSRTNACLTGEVSAQRIESDLKSRAISAANMFQAKKGEWSATYTSQKHFQFHSMRTIVKIKRKTLSTIITNIYRTQIDNSILAHEALKFIYFTFQHSGKYQGISCTQSQKREWRNRFQAATIKCIVWQLNAIHCLGFGWCCRWWTTFLIPVLRHRMQQ